MKLTSDKRVWDQEDDEYILEWYPRLPRQELADALDCTPKTVRSRYWWLVRKYNLDVSHKKGPHTTILTEAEIKQIQYRRARGEQRKDLAEEYGVSKSTITRIVSKGRNK